MHGAVIFTIIGTLVGFVGAIYLPMSMLPEGVGKVLKCLPVLHGAAMMRTVCTEDAIAKTFDGLPAIAGETFREQMGVSVLIEKMVFPQKYQCNRSFFSDDMCYNSNSGVGVNK